MNLYDATLRHFAPPFMQPASASKEVLVFDPLITKYSRGFLTYGKIGKPINPKMNHNWIQRSQPKRFTNIQSPVWHFSPFRFWGSTPAASVRDQRGRGGNRGWRTPAITLGVIRQEIPWKIRGLDRCQWPMSMRRKIWLLIAVGFLVAIWRWPATLGHLYPWTCFGEET